MTPEFTHCALHVRDLDESIAFYESYCGLRVVKKHGKGKERTVWMAHAEEGAAFVLVLLGGGPERQQSKDEMRSPGSVASRLSQVPSAPGSGKPSNVWAASPQIRSPKTRT